MAGGGGLEELTCSHGCVSAYKPTRHRYGFPIPTQDIDMDRNNLMSACLIVLVDGRGTLC